MTAEINFASPSWLGERLGELLGVSVAVDSVARLTGGASRESWEVVAVAQGRPLHLVVRRDPPTAPRPERLALEQQLLVAAADAGVPVPAVLAVDLGGSVLGSPALVLEHVPGEVVPKRILHDERFSSLRDDLAGRLGEILAAVHAIDPSAVPSLGVFDRLDAVADEYRDIGLRVPAFTLALRWLDSHRPRSSDEVVVHGDFRVGNLIVGDTDVRAVLDWEAARLGDPHEDIAWLTVRAWRFGGAGEVGGVGTVDELVERYERRSGRSVDRDALIWWQVAGTLRWGVGCLRQVSRYRRHEVRTVEMAVIGRRAAENEFDVLVLLEELLRGVA